MFKAKLIPDPAYYKLRSRQVAFAIVSGMMWGISVNMDLFSNTWLLLLVPVFGVVIIWGNSNQKLMATLLSRKTLEIDNDQIRVLGKKGAREEVVNLADLQAITVKKEYGFPQETWKEWVEEMSGKTKENFIIIRQKDQQRRYDFEVDSHYMLVQLNKIINAWEQTGLEIQKV